MLRTLIQLLRQLNQQAKGQVKVAVIVERGRSSLTSIIWGFGGITMRIMSGWCGRTKVQGRDWVTGRLPQNIEQTIEQ